MYRSLLDLASMGHGYRNPAFRRGFCSILGRIGFVAYATILVTTPAPESICGTSQRRFRGYPKRSGWVIRGGGSYEQSPAYAGLCSWFKSEPIGLDYATILVTTPAPTVLPPSRIAKRLLSSRAIGPTSLTLKVTVSPGITISTPSASVTSPVTSVVPM